MSNESNIFSEVKKISYKTQEYKSLLEKISHRFRQETPEGEDFREFQASTVAKTIYGVSEGFRRILIHKPTGAGKTIISRNLFGSPEMREALGVKEERPLKVLFIANRKRLLQQAERTYERVGNVAITTISTSLTEFPKDILEEGWDVTCLDEAHHESMTSFQLYLESITQVPLIGLTATPYRPDNCILKFELVINEITRAEAVEQGYLAETDVYTIVNVASNDSIDFIKRVFRDFKNEISRCIVAVRTRKEVGELVEFLKTQGFEGVCGILNQTDEELNDVLDQFSAGELNILVNCSKINEGIDVKGCETVFLGRSFDSVIQLNQTIGRGARPDTPCTVFEIIDPVKAKRNALDIVEKTKSHKFIYYRDETVKIHDFKTRELLEVRESKFIL